jgi:hypothetical protein
VADGSDRAQLEVLAGVVDVVALPVELPVELLVELLVDDAVELLLVLSAELPLDELSVDVPDVELLSVVFDVDDDVEFVDEPPRLSVL